MKTILKIAAFLIINIFNIYAQTGWKADLRVSAERYIQLTEINIDMICDVYFNGQLVTIQPDYKFEWYRSFPLDENPTWQLVQTTFGNNTSNGTHAYQDSTLYPAGKMDFYCRITIPYVTVFNSDNIRVPWYSVDPDQKKSTGSSFGSVDYWYKGSFKDNAGLGVTYIPRYDPKVLQAETDVVLTPQEKYQSWSDNLSNTFYNNFIRFYPEDLLNNTMTSQFRYTNNATIRAAVDNYYLDVIKFKDPWMRDFNEAPFGLRNQGLDAVPQPLINAENNLPMDQTRQGVLKDQDPTFDPNIANYSIEIPSSIYLSQTGKTHNVYLQNWAYSGATLQYPNLLNTGVVFTSSGASVTANVKATQISDNSSAFTNNGQRKIVRTPSYPNTLHMVYESMGHVYYETSTNNGQTWILMNNGLPLDNGGGKCPSIDYGIINYNHYVVIVYQELYPPINGYKLKAAVYRCIGGDGPFNYLETETVLTSTDPYTYNTNPVVTFDYYGGGKIAWERTGDGLYHRSVSLLSDGLHLIGSNAKLSGTTSNSKNPSIAASKIINGSSIDHLVWEESNAVKYFTFNSAPPGTIRTISTGSNPINSRPSVIAASDGTARFCWQGQYYPGSNSIAVFRGPVDGHFWYFGSNIRTPQITWSDDNTSYFIIWNEAYTNATWFTDNYTLSDLYNLNTSGQAVQLSNGATRDNMYALVYSSQTVPKYFKVSPSIGSKYGLGKTTSSSGDITGRGGSVLKDSSGFFFMLKNISANGQLVDFVKVSDTISAENISDLSSFMVSKPFVLNDNSEFNYIINYGPTNEFASEQLGETDQIKFKLDLVDALTNETIGSLSEVLFNKYNSAAFNEEAYNVNTDGIGGIRNVYLKITEENNFEGKYILTESYSNAESGELQKTNIKKIDYNELLPVKDYALIQNYPNPFNPSTIINYQIPKEGFITLKIYDMLGKEVKTLVNEYKGVGRYEVKFDASDLSSGMYIYQIKANEFISSKKMLLVK